MNADNPFQNPITRRSLDQLEIDLISISSHINAQEYEFLVLLREFDLRHLVRPAQPAPSLNMPQIVSGR